MVPDEELSPRRRRRRERNRSQLLIVAREVFEERGYVETTVQDVIDAADVSRGTFYHYFDSKDAMFGQLLGELVEAFHRAATDIGEERSVRNRLDLSMSRLMDTARRHRRMLVAVDQAVHVSEVFAKQWGEFASRLERSVGRDLTWCMEHGMIDRMPPETLHTTSMVLSGAIEAALIRVAVRPPEETRDIDRILASLYWNSIFRPHEGAEDYVVRPGRAPLKVLATGEDGDAAGAVDTSSDD